MNDYMNNRKGNTQDKNVNTQTSTTSQTGVTSLFCLSYIERHDQVS